MCHFEYRIQLASHPDFRMGVKQLWKILSPCGKRPVFENKTLAIDTSIWMHYYKSIPDNMVTISMSKRILRILYNKIRPVFIFDGKPSALKRETIIKRKEDEMRSLIRRIVQNKKCAKCGELLKNCAHINDFDENELMKLNADAVQKLKTHKYNWGELSNDTDDDVLSEEDVVIDGNVKDNPNETTTSKRTTDTAKTSNIIANFNYESLSGLSKQKQLEKLVDLRSKRGLPMGFDNSDTMSFSKSQIENLKKRNMISTMIRSLNKNAKKVIQSDCTAYTELQKDEPGIYRSFYYKDEKDDSVEDDKDQESSDINDLFNKKEHNEWEDVFERYENKHLKVDDSMIEKHTQYNTEIMKIVGNDPASPSANKIRISEQSHTSPMPVPADVPETSEQNKDISSDIPEFFLDTTSSESEGLSPLFEKSSTIKLETLSNDLQRVQKLIIELLIVLELPYIESIGETDAQCGYLSRNGLIDGIISEDNDMIIQKGTVYKNFFRKDKDIVCYSYEDVVKELGLDQDALIKAGYLLGSDYCDGVKGVGIKSVLAKLDTVSEDNIAPYRIIYNDENVKKIDAIKFGALNVEKFRSYLLMKGVDISKIDELMLYCKKITEG